MSIAVLSERQGQGIGQALVRAFLSEAAQRGSASSLSERHLLWAY